MVPRDMCFPESVSLVTCVPVSGKTFHEGYVFGETHVTGEHISL